MRRICFGLLCFTLAAGCNDRDDTTMAARDGAPPDAPTGAGDAAAADTATSDAAATTLYQRLGSAAGIRTVMTDFVVNRVLPDPRINGYFLNSTVNGTRVIDCLVLQVGALTGGPEQYPSNGCRDMKSSHQGLKISTQDFTDLAGHLVAALQAAGVQAADVNAIVAAVMPMASDIVEDSGNDATVYQRVGRKPAIATVIDQFIAKVVADTRINGFFTGIDAQRLKTCLVRQVCSIDGPCQYGREVAGEPGVSPANPCRDMRSSHAGARNPRAGGAGSRGISKADFNALVEDLVEVLDAARVAAADKAAILGALGPMCPDIVEGGAAACN